MINYNLLPCEAKLKCNAELCFTYTADLLNLQIFSFYFIQKLVLYSYETRESFIFIF